jgi:hypothetical protein
MNLQYSAPNRMNRFNFWLLAAAMAALILTFQLAIIPIESMKINMVQSTEAKMLIPANRPVSSPQVVPVPTPAHVDQHQMPAPRMSATPIPVGARPVARPVATPPAGK